MPLETYPFDAAEYIDGQGEIEILADAASTGDTAYICLALQTVARSRGMTAIAREAGITRQALFEALGSQGAPRIDVLLDVFRALGAPMPDAAASAAE